MTIPIKQEILTDVQRQQRTVSISANREFLGVDKRTWTKYLKEAWYHAGVYWHEYIMQKHFTQAGAKEYHYQPRQGSEVYEAGQTKDGKAIFRRSKSYESRKYSKWGHRLPLVWSGKLKQDAHRVQDVRATSNGVNIVIHGPKYLYAYRKDLDQPDKAAELRAISERDAQMLANVMDQSLENQANNKPNRLSPTSGHRRAV